MQQLDFHEERLSRRSLRLYNCKRKYSIQLRFYGTANIIRGIYKPVKHIPTEAGVTTGPSFSLKTLVRL